MKEPVSIDGLTRAIAIWETAMDCYKENMARIKKAHRFTWWLKVDYWANERAFHKSFTALIQRRIQLQTAIKERNGN